MRKSSRMLAAMLVAAIALSLGGCSSAVDVTVKTVGTTEKTVDVAMSTWGAFVRDGKATADQEAKVRGGYEAYQKALANAITVLHVTQSTETPAELQKAAADLVLLIQTLTGKPLGDLRLLEGKEVSIG